MDWNHENKTREAVRVFNEFITEYPVLFNDEGGQEAADTKIIELEQSAGLESESVKELCSQMGARFAEMNETSDPGEIAATSVLVGLLFGIYAAQKVRLTP